MLCPYCREIIEDNIYICPICEATLKEENENSSDSKVVKRWIITCPVDGKSIIVYDEKSKCENCRYENDNSVIYDFGKCKPFFVERVYDIPSEETVSVPTLYLEEISADFDEENIGHIQESHIEYLRAPICIKGSGKIGRNGDIDRAYFEKDLFISDEHCLILRDDINWYVEHIGNTNPTCVNENKLSRKVKHKLLDGYLLQVADKMFIVSVRGFELKNSLGQNPSSINADNNNEDCTTSACWQIVCPNCGHRYTVDDEKEKIKECKYCSDFLKYDISNVAAVMKHVN